MKKQFEAQYHRLEQENWWSVARRDMLLRLIGRLGLSYETEIIEVGCAGGPLLADLQELGYRRLTGIDCSAEAIARCRERALRNVQVMDGAKLDFADNSFDLLIASDVLEHIEDHEAALKEWRRVLKPTGRLLVFVPAFMFLWGGHDRWAMHYRRYTRRQLVDVMQQCGLQVERSSYWNALLFPPVACVRVSRRWLNRLRGTEQTAGHDIVDPPVYVNRIMIESLKLENRLLQHVNLPVGVSTFAIARVPKAESP